MRSRARTSTLHSRTSVNRTSISFAFCSVDKALFIYMRVCVCSNICVAVFFHLLFFSRAILPYYIVLTTNHFKYILYTSGGDDGGMKFVTRIYTVAIDIVVFVGKIYIFAITWSQRALCYYNRVRPSLHHTQTPELQYVLVFEIEIIYSGRHTHTASIYIK